MLELCFSVSDDHITPVESVAKNVTKKLALSEPRQKLGPMSCALPVTFDRW